MELVVIVVYTFLIGDRLLKRQDAVLAFHCLLVYVALLKCCLLIQLK